MTEATGRYVAGLTMTGTARETVGSPLASAEERLHSHEVTGSVTIPQNSLAASAGSNNNYAAHGTYALEDSTSNEGHAGLPYHQVLLCEKP